MGEGEWQGEGVEEPVEVEEVEGHRVEDRVGVKVWVTVKDREPVGDPVATLGVGEGEAALGDTGALALPLPVATLTVEEGEPTVTEAGGDSDTVPVPHWEILVVGHWEEVRVATGVAYVGVTVGAPLLALTVRDREWVGEWVKEGGRVPLMELHPLPVPLPPPMLVVVLLPVPSGGLLEGVWDTLPPRLPDPLTVIPTLGVAGKVATDPKADGDVVTVQDKV